MIIQCPSCKSKFKMDSSRISGPVAQGRCSVCGEVFPLLDYATDVMEATTLRDKLEDERAARIKEMMAQQKARQREAEEKAAAERMAISREAAEKVEPEELPDFQEIPAVEGALFEEAPASDAMAESDHGEAAEKEESGLEIPEETDRKSEEVQELGSEGEERAEETITTPELSEQSLQEEEKESADAENTIEEKGLDQDSEELENMDVPLEELGEIKPSGKRSTLMPVLLIILLLVVLGGGGWYLYNSGQSGIFNSIVEKIKGLSEKTNITLFNLKNEQEPALDGKFFAVRGMIQSKRDKPVRFVPLRIKIFNDKNKPILTGQTIAGEVLSAEQISKMSVQNVMKKQHAFVESNKKAKGILDAGKKLPFLFLFDLSRFPRKLAKSFQIEVVGPLKP